MASGLGHIIHSSMLEDQDWKENMLEQLRLLVFDGMQAYVLLMAAFFCLFVYYCIFGFIVGAIAESNMDAPAADNPSAPEKKRT